MVLSERGVQDIRSGRRSRAESPNNGHLSDESSTTDETEYSMKVGEEYQATIPDLISNGPCPAYETENALLIWAPNPNIDDEKLDKYINEAKEKCGYNVEQALGMLFWHKYDIEKATADLQNYTPLPDEWTVEDKVLFEQGYQFHGKSFNRIRQMLPDKSLASLIKFYYLWKKARSRTSLMDRQVRKLSAMKEEGSGSEAPSDNESDMDPDKDSKAESSGRGTCSNCSVSAQLYNTPKGNLCSPCCQYFKRTGTLRSSAGTMRTSARHNPARSKRKPPRGMHLNYDDLVAIVTGPSGEGDAILRSMDCEIISFKRQVQNNKQMISQLKHKMSSGIDMYRPSETGTRINTRWNSDELLLAVQAIRKYGRNFKAVAEVVGNKTEANVRSFFVNYRRRFNLDGVLQEYEAEHGVIGDADDKGENESNSSVGNNSHPNSPQTNQATPPLLHPPQSPSGTSTTNGQQRLCPPALQQANSSRNNVSGRTLLHQPPPLICPTNNYINGGKPGTTVQETA